LTPSKILDKNSAVLPLEPRFVGVDPGLSGGVAVLDARGGVVLCTATPITERDIAQLFAEIRRGAGRLLGTIERVQPMPRHMSGSVGNFKLGKSYGTLLAILTVARVQFEEVQPRRWQQALGCLSGGDKNVTKRRAQQLFPATRVTHAVADALLLAEYCRRTEASVRT
jgi:hypothetical protein